MTLMEGHYAAWNSDIPHAVRAIGRGYCQQREAYEATHSVYPDTDDQDPLNHLVFSRRVSPVAGGDGPDRNHDRTIAAHTSAGAPDGDR